MRDDLEQAYEEFKKALNKKYTRPCPDIAKVIEFLDTLVYDVDGGSDLSWACEHLHYYFWKLGQPKGYV